MNRWLVLFGVSGLVVLALVSSGWIPQTAHASPALSPNVISMTHYDTSPPLTQMVAIPVQRGDAPARELRSADAAKHNVSPDVNEPDEALEKFFEREEDEEHKGEIPVPLAGWNGINALSSSCNCAPPDTNGDVGLNHYVQAVNTAIQIWDKNGNSLYGPAPANTLFFGFGGKCETTNDGDPIILYDPLADRWFFSQFANVFTSGPYYQCFAVSATGDPTGSWHRYELLYPGGTILNDYGKFGVWSDGYYMTANQFHTPGFAWAGTGVLALERAKMLNGQAAQVVYFNLGPTDWGGMLPSDLDGPAPAAGTPNYFLEIQDKKWDPVNIPQDQMTVHAFHVDWTTPSNSTFTNVANLQVANFDGKLCNFNACVPQKGTAQKLDTLGDRTMFRAQYRDFGSYASIVTNHTVDVGNNRAGIRWYEIRIAGGTPSINQQSTYSPGTLNRWMGSAAMDQDGNLAIGFSRSSAKKFPGIFYAGRLAGDTPNVLVQGEAKMKQGKGSQIGTVRWGDYSNLVVDPSDGCTFWFTSEYYKTTGSFSWSTWIGKFKFAECD